MILADDGNTPKDPLELAIHESHFKPANNLVPINVNYFIFNGQMEPESINSLESIFKANNGNNLNQNQLFVIEHKPADKLIPQPQREMTPGELASELLVKQGILNFHLFIKLFVPFYGKGLIFIRSN